MNKTKIVCTIGPASSELTTLSEMVDAGMNVARLNLSHGTHAVHSEYIQKLKAVREKKGVSLGILFDLKGPEFRIRQFENGAVILGAMLWGTEMSFQSHTRNCRVWLMLVIKFF